MVSFLKQIGIVRTMRLPYIDHTDLHCTYVCVGEHILLFFTYDRSCVR